MACRLSYQRTATNTMLVLLLLIDASLVLEHAAAAPAKRNDIIAGTEFLSVFINGAIAPTPRRRSFRRGGINGSNNDNTGGSNNVLQDNVGSETRVSEASIFRISRAPSNPTTARPGHRQTDMQHYLINHKSMEHRPSVNIANAAELENTEGIGVRLKPPASMPSQVHSESVIRVNASRPSMIHKATNRKVIGVSVTSTVEATPYRVRVEHYDNEELTVVKGPPVVTPPPIVTIKPLSTIMQTTSEVTAVTLPVSSSSILAKTTAATTTLPAKLVTEELNNIVSESNRSEFSVDEGSPRTSWRAKWSVTPESVIKHSTPFVPSSTSFVPEDDAGHGDSMEMETSSDPIEQSYHMPMKNSEEPENEDGLRMVEHQIPHGRKAGRHYDASLFNQPPKVFPQPSKIYGKPSRVYNEPTKVYREPDKAYSDHERVYGEPAKVYSEPAKIYSEPSKVYSEPSRIYGEPARIYGEPEKVYSEPSKIYSEPAQVYSEPAKFYGEPSKVYGEPSKVYGSNGQPVIHEPEEQNYEVDEAVSVGSNGNVHGPQIITEAPNASAVDDGHKVGYVVEGRNFRKYRVEERTPDGFIVGEYGVVSHDDGSLRGVRYTADGTINPRLIYDALMKFLAL